METQNWQDLQGRWKTNLEAIVVVLPRDDDGSEWKNISKNGDM